MKKKQTNWKINEKYDRVVARERRKGEGENDIKREKGREEELIVVMTSEAVSVVDAAAVVVVDNSTVECILFQEHKMISS